MIAHIRKDTKEQQSVEKHLLGTAEIAEKFGKELGIKALSKLTALVHDLGKMRKRFEEYLIASVTESRQTRRGEVNHSSAGAIFLEEHYNKGESIARLTAQLMVIAVFSHHGLNDCITPEGKNCYQKRVECQKELDYEEVIENFKKSSIYKEELDTLFEKAKKEVSSIIEKAKKNNIKAYFMAGVLERMLLSVLIDADRLDTAIFSGDRSKEEFLERNKKELCEKEINDELQNNMQKYVSDLENGKVENEEIANIRKQISKECEQFAKNPSGIYRLPVPTGGGKTISSFRYGLNHAKEHKKKRIFYIAPYVSILDQNANVIKDAIGKEKEDFVLVHHSNVITKMEDSGQKEEVKELEDEETYRHLTENWEHPIVITTFVQFLNTLFSDSTQSIRRFHNLAHSVIIIDEIQTLPIRMTALFNQMMNILHEIFGATIVLCSATQPKLEQEKLEFPIHYTEPKDMISNVPMLYEKLKRVKVEIEKKKLDRMKIATFLMQTIEDKQSLLCILNTKTSARKVYENLQSLVKQWNQEKTEEEQITVFHLSTNMCVQNRLDKLDEMKVLLDRKTRKGKVICISTALIEAGVDISFECVVRGRAGLDSIAQAAGRCNRNGETIEGIVYIIREKEERLGNLLEIENGIQCSGPVLDDFLERPEYYQMDLFSPKALEKYYDKKYNPKDDKLKQQMRYPLEKGDMVDLLTENETGLKACNNNKPGNLMMCQAFRTAGKEFEVVVQNTTGVIVPYKEGKKIIADLCKDSYEIDVKELLKQAQQYTVNLYQNQIEQLNQKGGIIRILDNSVMVLKEGFYKEDFGVFTEGEMEFLEV